MRSSLFLSVAIAFCVAITSASAVMPNGALHARIFSSDASGTAAMVHSEVTAEDRVARRFQERVQNRYGFTLSMGEVQRAIADQRRLLSRSVRTEFATDTGETIEPWIVRADRFLTVEVTPAGMRSAIDPSRIVEEFAGGSGAGIRLPRDTTLLATTRDEDGIWRAGTEGIATAGYAVRGDVAQTVADELRKGSATLAVELHTAPGRIRNDSLEELGDLQLLSTGRSDFAGSGEGRKANVRKGLTKYLHNAMVEPGQEFSINGIMKQVPIREWEMALGIFGGGILRPVAGGGICQVATTLYRSILNGGFPVTQRSNHSLFVHYYEKYGVGIDSTIFPASAPDLRFVNDTEKPLLIQAYVEGTEAIVNIYGTPDGRSVHMTGPYFAENAPEEFRVNGKKLSSREIAWVRDVEYADGRTVHDTVLSRYKMIPRSAVKEYATTLSTVAANVQTTGQEGLHAAAMEEDALAADTPIEARAHVH